MENRGRLFRAKRNIASSFIFRVLNVLGSFLEKTALIYFLGIQYAGLNGLFSSVFMLLNIVESGFGSAVIYKMYKPISQNDDSKVCALLNFYRIVYYKIGLIVFLIGVGLTPFLKVIVNADEVPNLNIYILYYIYLLNTCMTYWLFSYRGSLLNALQRVDAINIVNCVVIIGKHLMQIAILFAFRNYYLYILILPVFTIINNVLIALYSKRKYPQYTVRGDIEETEKKDIMKKVWALFFNKVGVSIINGSDNIVISMALGLSILGIYNSYYYVFIAVYDVLWGIYSAVMPGIGNSIAAENVEYNFSLFKKIYHMNQWLVSWCSISLFCLLEPFIGIWIGENKALGSGFAFLMSLYLFFWTIRFPVIIFKSACGLWYEERFRPLIEGLLNLVMNIVLVRIIGIYGVVISTIFAMIIVSMPWESGILYKLYLKKDVKSYITMVIRSFIIHLAICFITYSFSQLVTGHGVLNLCIRACICLLIPNIIYLVLYYFSPDLRGSYEMLANIIMKRKGR